MMILGRQNISGLASCWKACSCTGASCMTVEGAREIQFQSCWGLEDDMFALVGLCRKVKFLSLERCSLLTTRGLESVITSWSDLQSLEVVSCNKIKDEEITPARSELVFSNPGIDLSCSRSYQPTNGSKGRCST